VYAADVDGEGEVDVLCAGGTSGSGQIGWWENDGAESFATHIVADQNINGAESVHAADMDSDGDVDLLGAASEAGAILWYKNKEQAPERVTIW
jgi:hypothetical protein